MVPSRRYALAVVSTASLVIAGFILQTVLATIFFAITVAYVLVPLDGWLRRRGLPAWWASVAATATAFLAVVALFLPFAFVLYIRRQQLVAYLTSLPDRITVEAFGLVYAIEAGDVTDLIIHNLTRIAIEIARTTPVLAAKVVVFTFVVFALLLRRSQLRRALLAPVPKAYHELVHDVHARVRSTLFALYVIQAATGLGTFLVALPLFWLLGYQFPITLAVLAGILQFIPVVGPSLLIVALAGFQLSAGATTAALLVLVLGLVFVGFLPDAILRPRLARQTADLPASLYFIGFTGGILTLGPVGIIAGPLVVVVAIELVEQLSDELNPASLPRSRP